MGGALEPGGAVGAVVLPVCARVVRQHPARSGAEGGVRGDPAPIPGAVGSPPRVGAESSDAGLSGGPGVAEPFALLPPGVPALVQDVRAVHGPGGDGGTSEGVLR